MQKIKITSSLIIPILSASTGAGASTAHSNHTAVSIRLNISFRFSMNGKSHDNIQILESLKGIGIETDDKTEIFVHEEADHLDFECFNCIVSERNVNDLGPQPVNDDELPIRRGELHE